MIWYTIKTTDCMQAILNCIGVGKAQYWTSSEIDFLRADEIISKLTHKYKLNTESTFRQGQLRKGHPVWSMVLNFDVKNPDKLKFWLFCTGYRATVRASKKKKNQFDTLNVELKKSENLNSIITSDPNQLIRFKDYVLGQYVFYEGLRHEFAYQHLIPEKYGIKCFQTEEFDKDFVVHSIDKNLPDYIIRRQLSLKDIEKYEVIKQKFGFLYLDEKKRPNSFKREWAIDELQRVFGVKVNDDLPYQDVMKQLFKYYRRMQSRYVDVFKYKSNKKFHFTWYLQQNYVDSILLESKKHIKNFVQNPQNFDAMLDRLFAKTSFHGVRHQIGRLNAVILFLLKRAQPRNYYRVKQQRNLPYVRFSAKKFTSFDMFKVTCVEEQERIKRSLIKKQYKYKSK